jgi:DNA-binding transcriptional MerR regulator
MGLPLREIHSALNDRSLDPKAALEQYGADLERRIARLERILRTVHRTLCALEEKERALPHEQLYEGSEPEDVEHLK